MQKLYILKCNNFYKIGIAGNVKKRIETLQTGNPYKIELVKSFNHIPAKYVEKFLHGALKEYRISGEWFSFGEEGIKTLISIVDNVQNNFKENQVEAENTSEKAFVNFGYFEDSDELSEFLVKQSGVKSQKETDK